MQMKPTNNDPTMYDKVVDWIDTLVMQWTSTSPTAYRIITNVASVVGIGATAVLLIPATAPTVVLPVWTIPVAAFLVAIAAKLTTKKDKPNPNP